MALYPMFPQTSPTTMYQDHVERQRALQAQSGYYSEQHVNPQPQGLGMSDANPTFTPPFTTAFGHISTRYPMPPQPYQSAIPLTEDLHHGYHYPRHMVPGMLPGMQDESDTASRPRLTAEQTRELEALFAANNKPSTQQKQEYAQRFRLTKNRVDNWFQNRRAKSKHQNKAKQALNNNDEAEPQSATSATSGNTTLSSQDNTIDLMSTSTFGNATEITSQDESVVAPHQTSWNSIPQTSRQDSGHSSYGQATTQLEGQFIESDPCQSPSAISQNDSDYQATPTFPLAFQFPSEYAPEAFIRRGSALTDLASHMSEVRLPSTITPTQSAFGNEARRGFGDRRAQRPAALSTMRSVSSGNVRTPLGTPLRRMNTSGTALNKDFRVQKHSTMTPQRSPISLSHAIERARNSLTSSEAVSPSNIGSFDDVEDPDQDAGVTFSIDPPSAAITWNDGLNPDFPVPPLSASLTGDDASPPYTPLPGQSTFGNLFTGQGRSAHASSAPHTFTHPSPMMSENFLAPQGPTQQYWDSAQMSDMLRMTGSYDFGSNSLPSQYTFNPSVRQSNEERPYKFEFSPSYQEAASQYYVPLRENQNFTFHQYQPDARQTPE